VISLKGTHFLVCWQPDPAVVHLEYAEAAFSEVASMLPDSLLPKWQELGDPLPPIYVHSFYCYWSRGDISLLLWVYTTTGSKI
jgi:hypothetical protein